MKHYRLLLTSMVILLTISLFPMPSNAAHQTAQRVTSGKTVYGTTGFKSSVNYIITMPTSGEMVMDLKTDGGVIITMLDKDGQVVSPSTYKALTTYGSHAGRDSFGYYLSYANTNETKVAHALFWYQLLPGEYTISFYGKYSSVNSVEMTVTTPVGFSDVADNAWYAEPVKWAIESNITAGTSSTTFSPGATCSTGQILTFLWRANGSPEPYKTNPFSDVTDQFYSKAAIWAYENGLVYGNTFEGDSPCTRKAVVKYLWLVAGQPTVDIEINRFNDIPDDSDYAQAVAWAVDQGITSGTGHNTFSPDDTCTRGQIVSFLYRYFN